jgi:tRNA A37 threonylcarbamoyltransferase TsaD
VVFLASVRLKKTAAELSASGIRSWISSIVMTIDPSIHALVAAALRAEEMAAASEKMVTSVTELKKQLTILYGGVDGKSASQEAYTIATWKWGMGVAGWRMSLWSSLLMELGDGWGSQVVR